MQQTKALLIRKYRLSETSLILVWLTQEHGKVKTAAQGAMKQASTFAGCLDLFGEVEIAFSWSKKSDLHILKEVVPMIPQRRLIPGYLTLLSASYFAELCDLFIELSHPVPELFDLLSRAFGFLSNKAPTRAAVEYFERELAKALGIYNPSLSAEESLSATGSQLPPSRKRLLDQLGAEKRQTTSPDVSS
ncbi:MAG: DNA repair protein RecO [Verrucomicrobia bacterium]|jgi:DNA repair protein RecO (recombination protein O)|nr:MAG: DNA repair protein RecO [Verrucomicrobiota bacterium]